MKFTVSFVSSNGKQGVHQLRWTVVERLRWLR